MLKTSQNASDDLIKPHPSYISHNPRLTQPKSLPRLLPRPIPPRTLLESNALPTKDIQRATDRKINLALTQTLHELQVLEVPPTARVRHGDRADARQVLDQRCVDAGLFALDVGGVD